MNTPSPNDAYDPAAWLLDGHGGARRLNADELAAWRPTDGDLWICLAESSERDRAWLETGSGLEPGDLVAFLRTRTWSRVLLPSSEEVLLLMRVPVSDATSGRSSVLRVWVESARIITMAATALPELRRLQDDLAAGKGPRSVDGVLLSVMQAAAAWLADAVLDLDSDVARFRFDDDAPDPRTAARIHRMHRRVLELQRYAAPLRSLLLRLRSFDLDWLTQEKPDAWLAVIDYVDEASHELDWIASRVDAMRDALASRTSDQINRRVYVLTIVSTIVLPLSLVTGLFGSNIGVRDGNVFGAGHPIWFIALCAGLALLGWATYAFFHRIRYL